MQHGWKNQPKFYLSISSYIYIYIPYLSSLIYIIPVWSFISISWACKSSSEKRTRYWRRKGGCLEWSLIRNHCLSFILAFPVVCVWERERERDWSSGMERGVWNEVWSKIIPSNIFNFPYVCFLIYLHKFVCHHFTSCMGWDWSRTRLHSSHLPFLVEAINHNKTKVIPFFLPNHIRSK